MLFAAWKHKERNRQTNVFTMTSGGFVIAVRNNSLNDSNRAHLVTILKTLSTSQIRLRCRLAQCSAEVALWWCILREKIMNRVTINWQFCLWNIKLFLLATTVLLKHEMKFITWGLQCGDMIFQRIQIMYQTNRIPRNFSRIVGGTVLR